MFVKKQAFPRRHRSSPLASCDRNTLWSIEMSTKDILPATFPSSQVSEVTTTSRKHKGELIHTTWPLPHSPHVPHYMPWLNAKLCVCVCVRLSLSVCVCLILCVCVCVCVLYNFFLKKPLYSVTTPTLIYFMQTKPHAPASTQIPEKVTWSLAVLPCWHLTKRKKTNPTAASLNQYRVEACGISTSITTWSHSVSWF